MAALTACGIPDTGRQRLCADALAGLELDAGGLTIDIVSESRRAVTLSYKADGKAHEIACRFSGSVLGKRSQEISEITVDSVPVSAVRMQLLKRFWLSQVTTASQRARLQLPQYAPWLVLPKAAAYALQQVINATPLAAIYTLLALAYALVYGLTERINLAFGEMTAFASIAAVIGFFAGSPGGLAAAIALAFAAAVIAALALSRLVTTMLFQPLAFRSGQAILVATIGLSIALQEAMRLGFGSGEFWLPQVLSTPVVLAGGDFTLVATPKHAAITLSVVTAITVLFLLLRTNRMGFAWRAVADDAGAARLMGINPDRVLAAAFIAAAVLIALAGVILSVAYGSANAGMGLVIGLKALVAAILGGIGSLPGALLGGVLLAVLETMWTAYFPADYRDVFVFACLIAVLILRPQGLLGRARQPRV